MLPPAAAYQLLCRVGEICRIWEHGSSTDRTISTVVWLFTKLQGNTGTENFHENAGGNKNLGALQRSPTLLLAALPDDTAAGSRAVRINTNCFSACFFQGKYSNHFHSNRKVENDFPEIEPTVLFQSNEEVAKQDYDLTNAVLENFCKTYNAKLERTSTDTKQGYLLKIPVYNARSNLQLHANIPRRRRSTFLNNYQVMLYDISDYRFY